MRFRSLNKLESDVEAEVVGGLRLLGYTVLVTSRRVKLCPHCGGRQRGDDGASRGIPDLIVSHPSWGRGVWLGAELKSPTGRLRPEQRELADAGRIVVWRSLEDALVTIQLWPGYDAGRAAALLGMRS